MKPNFAVKIGKLKLKNPVMAASGAFGYAEEFKDFIDLSRLGAIVSKTVTLNPRAGNPPARTCETPAGMLNSIGLENPGIDGFVKDKLPQLRSYGVPVIVSISADKDPKEFLVLARHLDKVRQADAIELNISCPNLKKARLIAQDASATYGLVKAVRKTSKKTLITKLSPNVTDISEIARAAESAGSDAVCLVNTFYGMSINADTGRPRLASFTGGLSGPAIRPLAVRMVWEVYQKIKIPIIGMGGIMDTASAIEFFLAGASAVAVGTANFINPKVTVEIIKGLKGYLMRNKITDISSLTGKIKL